MLRNIGDQTPEDLAKEMGFYDLAEIIKSCQVNHFSAATRETWVSV
jgi:hypothetical protein